MNDSSVRERQGHAGNGLEAGTYAETDSIRPILLRIPRGSSCKANESLVRRRHYARQALRDCALAVGAPWDGWTQTEDGRPIPQSGWYWSVSHKGDWVAAVIARHPIGIDIEFIRPRSPRAWKALARPEEWDMIMTPRLSKISSVDSFLDGSPTYGSVDETLSASDFVQWLPFFRMWTAKEAVLKASGVGLERLDDCRLSDVGPSGGMTLNFESQSIGVEHDILGRSVAAVTTGPIPVKWQRNH